MATDDETHVFLKRDSEITEEEKDQIINDFLNEKEKYPSSPEYEKISFNPSQISEEFTLWGETYKGAYDEIVNERFVENVLYSFGPTNKKKIKSFNLFKKILLGKTIIIKYNDFLEGKNYNKTGKVSGIQTRMDNYNLSSPFYLHRYYLKYYYCNKVIPKILLSAAAYDFIYDSYSLNPNTSKYFDNLSNVYFAMAKRLKKEINNTEYSNFYLNKCMTYDKILKFCFSYIAILRCMRFCRLNFKPYPVIFLAFCKKYSSIFTSIRENRYRDFEAFGINENYSSTQNYQSIENLLKDVDNFEKNIKTLDELFYSDSLFCADKKIINIFFGKEFDAINKYDEQIVELKEAPEDFLISDDQEKTSKINITGINDDQDGLLISNELKKTDNAMQIPFKDQIVPKIETSISYQPSDTTITPSFPSFPSIFDKVKQSSTAQIQTTTPIQPIQSTAPIQPIQSITPIQPIQTTTPIQPIQTTTPIQPIQTTTPIQPIQTTIPIQPTSSIDNFINQSYMKQINDSLNNSSSVGVNVIDNLSEVPKNSKILLTIYINQ